MGITFNAGEVLQMAVRAEENAADFYNKAAELYKSKGKDGSFLLGLAGMEDEHKTKFKAMLSDLGEDMKGSTAFDPYMEAAMYLNTMADSSGIEGAPEITRNLTGEESVEDMLKMGIRLEKDAVIFYLGIRDMVPEKLGRDRIDTIIEEEKQHIIQLTGALRLERGE
ncbi:MAG: ferritin family protein [Kiritimatiellia bacterium]